jgi:rare lipoprotein A
MKSPVKHAVAVAALIALGAAGTGMARRTPPPPPPPVNGPAADYPVVIGPPFTVGDKTWTPEDRLNYDAVGYASVAVDAGPGISGAHKTLPLPAYVEVTSLASGRTILVRLERRGPMSNELLVELSPEAASQLGIADMAKAPVRVRRVNPPEAERAMLRGGRPVPERMATPRPLLDVLLRKLDPQLAPAAPAVVAPPPAAAKPAPRAARRPVAAPTPAAAPSPAPTIAAAPDVGAEPSAPPPPGARSDSLIVQVAAFSTRARADGVAPKLGARVSPAGRLWRVRMGPFGSRAEAEAALAKARAAGYSDARIQRTD